MAQVTNFWEAIKVARKARLEPIDVLKAFNLVPSEESFKELVLSASSLKALEDLYNCAGNLRDFVLIRILEIAKEKEDISFARFVAHATSHKTPLRKRAQALLDRYFLSKLRADMSIKELHILLSQAKEAWAGHSTVVIRRQLEKQLKERLGDDRTVKGIKRVYGAFEYLIPKDLQDILDAEEVKRTKEQFAQFLREVKGETRDWKLVEIFWSDEVRHCPESFERKYHRVVLERIAEVSSDFHILDDLYDRIGSFFSTDKDMATKLGDMFCEKILSSATSTEQLWQFYHHYHSNKERELTTLARILQIATEPKDLEYVEQRAEDDTDLHLQAVRRICELA